MGTSIRLSAFVVATTLALATGSISQADPGAAPRYSLYLRYEGATPSSPGDVNALYEKALEIVRSSNFNSRAPLWNWDLAEILSGYRRTADGHHLLVTYAQPQSIRTTGGIITVKEILIGLNGSQYASSLHTIDEEGRVVGHAKYSGELCIDMLKLVLSMGSER